MIKDSDEMSKVLQDFPECFRKKLEIFFEVDEVRAAKKVGI